MHLTPGRTGETNEERTAHSAPGRLSIKAISNFEELTAFVPAWQDLADDALEPNVFYEPWMFLPALRTMGTKCDLRLVFVLDSLSRLQGFFPLEKLRRYKGAPLRAHRTWLHRHCYLGMPLLRRDRAQETLAAFLLWLAHDRQGSSLMEFATTPGEGPFHQHLVDVCASLGRPTFVAECHTRAVLKRRAHGDEFIQAALSGQLRRGLRRKQKRLAKMGHLTLDVLERGQDVSAWIDEFLQLEASSWKGRTGTAMNCCAEDRGFFRTILTEAFARGRLLFLAMRLNGQPIAGRCSFLAGNGSFAFKTAFDESYGPYSPGAVLEVENIRRVHDLPAVEWMDSCSSPDNFAINRLWKDRRTIQTITVATGKAPGDLVVALLPLLRWLKRTLHI